MKDTKLCHTFDWDTGVYLFSEEVERQGNGEFQLVGFNCTFVELPKYEEHQIPVFNKETESWSIEPDYRTVPYYIISEYWWSDEHFMFTYGNIPEGASFNKFDKPQIVLNAIVLINEINTAKQYLADTDYVHNVIAEEPEKADKYAAVIEERKRVRATIDPKDAQLQTLKRQIAAKYGEEALNHLSEE